LCLKHQRQKEGNLKKIACRRLEKEKNVPFLKQDLSEGWMLMLDDFHLEKGSKTFK